MFFALCFAGVVTAWAQESGVFAFGPAASGLLLKLDVERGNYTTLSSAPSNNTFFAFEAARIHPTFKYWFQVFEDSSHQSVSIEGREIFPGARVTSSTRLPLPSVCAKGATNWTFFDLQCGGRPVFVLGTVVANQLSLALIEVNGTLKCLDPIPLGDSFGPWLQSGLDLDSILALSLDNSVLVLDITDNKPAVVARTPYPKPLSLSRLHYFFRPDAWFGFYSTPSGGVGLASLSASHELSLGPLLSNCTAPPSLLSTLDTDHSRLVGLLRCAGTLQIAAVDVATGKLSSSVPFRESLVSLNSLANVFAP